MTFELETIIKSKFYNELTFEEILALSDYCSNEVEFNVLKEMFTAQDLYQEEVIFLGKLLFILYCINQ